MPQAPHILLVSHSGEPHNTAAVALALADRGARATRLDTDLVPTRIALTIDAHGPPRLHGQPLEPDAAWIWRRWSPALPDTFPTEHRPAIARESATLLDGLLDTLPPERLLDPPARVQAASGKMRQLRAAARAGLAVVPTLHTCDPDAARDFWQQQEGDVMVKLHEQPVYGMTGSGGFPTRRLAADHLPALDALRLGPVMLQRRIPKAWELRVAWVDGLAFPGALDGARCGDDWRYEPGDNPWLPWALDPTVHASLARLMADLGLRQGAIDLIVTPQGEHAFLEVNPVGEWGMLHMALGLPIPEAIADALLEPR